jgi:hypothetical protein
MMANTEDSKRYRDYFITCEMGGGRKTVNTPPQKKIFKFKNNVSILFLSLWCQKIKKRNKILQGLAPSRSLMARKNYYSHRALFSDERVAKPFFNFKKSWKLKRKN